MGSWADMAVFAFRKQTDFRIAAEGALMVQPDECEAFRVFSLFVDRLPSILSRLGKASIDTEGGNGAV
jgi:hypothetical protein